MKFAASMWIFFEIVCFSLYRYTKGSEKGCGSFFLVRSFWVVVCSSGFVSFLPQKMSYLQSWVGCTCVLLSLIGKVFGNSNFCGRTAAVVLADY